jgi:hypothetical protein
LIVVGRALFLLPFRFPCGAAALLGTTCFVLQRFVLFFHDLVFVYSTHFRVWFRCVLNSNCQFWNSRLENTKGSLQSEMPGSNNETRGRFYDGFSSNIMVCVGPIITFHGRITAREYVDRLVNHVHPMIHTLFPKNNAVIQDYNAPIHTSRTVQSWFEEHEGELQHLWPA